MKRNTSRYLILAIIVVAVVVALVFVVAVRPITAPNGLAEEVTPGDVTIAVPVNTPVATMVPTEVPTVEPAGESPPLVVDDSPLASPTITAFESPLVQPVGSEAPLYMFGVINEFPHDPDAFTQGLVYVDGELYEGTGVRGRSSLREVNMETGEVLRLRELPKHLFGEGITVFDDKIYQLTWKAGTGYVYDKETFDLVSEFTYPTEGWGITHDGANLIMSDGSSTLYVRDPETFAEVGRIQVQDGGEPIDRLNELEYVDGTIYANIWLTDRIAQISPETGDVIGWIDQAGLLCPRDPNHPNRVLNGIAYDALSERLFVTCKLWPKLYEVELIPQ